ncbi:MAG: hypothetical protein COZ38_06540 [Rhodocyclales bacterium CG_4_10_14_3_um_filter_68_10]|nr:MAG: hypothetical protein COZ38_06540 [Rhodocyclales bacterium CG_4_10_14_3_um_filter_68_10]
MGDDGVRFRHRAWPVCAGREALQPVGHPAVPDGRAGGRSAHGTLRATRTRGGGPRWTASRASNMNANLPASELWLTLSQAFLPPRQPETARAFRSELADDLRVLTAELGLNEGERLEAFRRSLRGIGHGQELLVHYASLFLSPPVAAHLNLGFHLDGTLFGPTQDSLDAWFANHGVERSVRFRDLPDHLAALLEFLAMLAAGTGTAGQADDFARHFLIPALPGLCREIELASGDSPYLHLARFAAEALRTLAGSGEQAPAAKRHNRRSLDPAKGELRHCKVCGQPFAREKEIRLLTAALAERGLPAGHLDTCPDCRDPAQGWRFGGPA